MRKMKMTVHRQVMLILFLSSLTMVYLCISLATGSKTNATISGKRKTSHNDQNTNGYLSMSLSKVDGKEREINYITH